MKYKNPILKGFHPDPSICRVGEDYYLVTSSFEYFPGIPVYHSRDLINWEIINHCISNPNQLDYSKFGDSGGVWAPTIRYKNGRFYVTATIDKLGNIIVYTDNIRGEWSQPILVNMGGIDPSFYFEENRAYYCTNERLGDKEAITICEINPDTGVLIGKKSEIWYGIGEGWLEAPHIYKVNDWYYIFTAEGGTAYNHMVTVGRSKELFGTYEVCPWNPILTNRNDTSKEIQCAGHADLIDDIQGNWYIVHLGTRPCKNKKSNLGRETFLTPLQYKENWFFIKERKAKLENEINICSEQLSRKKFIMDLNKSEFEKEWLFLNKKKIAKNKELVLQAEVNSITFAGIRQPDFQCIIKTTFEFEPQNIGDESGLMVYLQSDYNYRICKKREADGDFIIVQKYAEDFVQMVYQSKAREGKINVCVKADKDFYSFYSSYKEDIPEEICYASTNFLCIEVPERCFTGAVIGVYTKGSTLARFLSFEER